MKWIHAVCSPCHSNSPPSPSIHCNLLYPFPSITYVYMCQQVATDLRWPHLSRQKLPFPTEPSLVVSNTDSAYLLRSDDIRLYIPLSLQSTTTEAIHLYNENSRWGSSCPGPLRSPERLGPSIDIEAPSFNKNLKMTFKKMTYE